MSKINNNHNNFPIIDKIKKSVIPEAVTIIPLKLPFEFFDICSEIGILTQLRINNIGNFYVELFID